MNRRMSRSRPAVLVGLTILLLLAGPAAAQTKVKPKDLAPRFQEWLDLTSYIITEKELDVFLHLQNDQDRDVFIKAFWNIRDPTPATPQNEFQEEHLKRFKEADYRFHFGSVKPGWKTDQGRFYIILGPPVSRTYIEGSLETYPAEIWSYYGDVSKGMPTHFQLCFFRYKNAGEFRLYDPVADGPARLLVDGTSKYAITDYQGIYEKLVNSQPDLAAIAFSIIPNEAGYNYQPSLESTIQLAAIIESPRKNLDVRYATHFLNYKGVVSTEYLTNYIKTEAAVAVVADPRTGLAFCDIALTPERLSLDLYEPKDEYSTNFLVDISLQVGETVILQYSKEYPLIIPADRLRDTEVTGLSIADSFPVIEGKIKLTVLLRNTVGKEFSIVEREIEVPRLDGPPCLLAPVFGAKTETVPAGAHVPFQAEESKLQVDPRGQFVQTDQIAYLFSVAGLSRELWEGGSIKVDIKGTNSAKPYANAHSFPLKSQRYERSLAVLRTMAASDFPPDYYQMTLSLLDGAGRAIDEKRGVFVVSPVASLPHPSVAAKSFSLNNLFMFHYMLAYQYSRTGQSAKALASYNRALGLNPSFLGKIPEYADFLIRETRFAEAAELVERIKNEEKLRFQYAHLRGRALAGLGRYREAVDILQAGNRIYNSDAGLLATLGTCYFKIGDMAAALEALSASLRLNTQQPEVKALIEQIEKKK